MQRDPEVSVDKVTSPARKGPRRTVPDQALPHEESAYATETALEDRMSTAALEVSPVAQLVVDAVGQLLLANQCARELFALRKSDVGRPLRDLQLSYRPIELRSLIDRSEMESCPIAVEGIEWKSTLGEPRCLDLHIAPVVDSMGSTIGAVLTYVDFTAYRRLQRQLEQSQQELGTAYEELQSTNEELKTTNGELQSTVEELETTNDELQSLTKSWKP